MGNASLQHSGFCKSHYSCKRRKMPCNVTNQTSLLTLSRPPESPTLCCYIRILLNWNIISSLYKLLHQTYPSPKRSPCIEKYPSQLCHTEDRLSLTEQERTPSLQMPPYCRSINIKTRHFLRGSFLMQYAPFPVQCIKELNNRKSHTGGSYQPQQPEREEAITQAVPFPRWDVTISCTYLLTGQLTRC